MLNIIMKTCSDDIGTFMSVFILKFLCPIFSRDVGFEYLEII